MALLLFLNDRPGTSMGYRGEQSKGNEKTENKMAKQMAVMQDFKVKKGFITDEALQLLHNDSETEWPESGIKKGGGWTKTKSSTEQHTARHKQKTKGKEMGDNDLSNASEVIIYHRAIREIAPQIENQTNEFISEVIGQDTGRKVSSSSEELMDTSDEHIISNLFLFFEDMRNKWKLRNLWISYPGRES